MGIPATHDAFLTETMPRLRRDDRLVGVAVGGSMISGALDEYSDLDFVVVVKDASFEEVMNDRIALIRSWCPVLAAFTGEHVGEPRLIICLVGPPLLHVDFKFVRQSEYGVRIEDPLVLWEHDAALTSVPSSGGVESGPNLQWIEDRFWVWVHYAATKLGRGELFEVIDCLASVRALVLGPMIALKHGVPPRGVRRLERIAPEDAQTLTSTLCRHDRAEAARSIADSVSLYRGLRDELAGRVGDVVVDRLPDAEREATAYLEQVTAALTTG